MTPTHRDSPGSRGQAPPDYLLRRPAGALDAGVGLLLGEHFQMAYVTTDMGQACDLMRSRLGIAEFRALEGPTPAGGYIQARLAWVGTIMYELLHCTGPGAGLYMDRLGQGDGFRMRHHHLGFLAHDRGQLDAAITQARGHGWPVPYVSSNPLVDACFVDVPALGHYLEYLLPTAAGLDFFNDVPRH